MRNITNPMEHWFEEGGNLGLRCPWPDDVPLILAALPFMASFSRSPHGSRWLEQIIKYVFQSTCRKKLKRKVGIIPWRTLPGSYTLFFFFLHFPHKTKSPHSEPSTPTDLHHFPEVPQLRCNAHPKARHYSLGCNSTWDRSGVLESKKLRSPALLHNPSLLLPLLFFPLCLMPSLSP